MEIFEIKNKIKTILDQNKANNIISFRSIEIIFIDL